ncbi:MAG: N-acetylmuramoyl-L-alanine amidase [Acidobacteriia bacterium]|nr:N-acetylmuramoyl-L-alanine amidase [Terriglobia bacterium]
MKPIAALAVTASMLAAQMGRADLSVTAVRHWSLADVTRVAIEVSGEFQFRSDRLHNPERVYFDIPGARPGFASRRSYTEILDNRLVSRIRVAETAPGVTRVVLDLGASVEVTPSQLANPSRLIIELRNIAASTVPDAPALAPPPSVPQAAVRREPLKLGPPAPLAPKPDIPRRAPAATATLPDPPKVESPAPAAPPAGLEAVGRAARHTSNGESSLVRTLGLKIARVVIDPGHGGHDQGTEGHRGLLEKDLVLDVALRVGKLIEDRMGAEVIYTRSDDTFVPLEGRTALANEKKADLFLSIHANSSAYPRIAGIETYYLNITGAKEALDVAARENAVSQKSVFELADLIQKIARHDKAEESREFAGNIQTALYAFSARNVPGSRNRGVRTAPFVVLIGANMPSVLAEVGFLSNPREETLLSKPDYRQKLAEALYRGISKYAGSLSHFQVASTASR